MSISVKKIQHLEKKLHQLRLQQPSRQPSKMNRTQASAKERVRERRAKLLTDQRKEISALSFALQSLTGFNQAIPKVAVDTNLQTSAVQAYRLLKKKQQEHSKQAASRSFQMPGPGNGKRKW
eukprot:763877-Hanusia_phi.AAC.2